ncbi:hypothetical protein V8E54_004952 [Elaphomyces granulatus]
MVEDPMSALQQAGENSVKNGNALGNSKDLSSSSPLELMIRIIALNVKPNSLEEYRQEVSKLNVTKQCLIPNQVLEEVADWLIRYTKIAQGSRHKLSRAEVIKKLSQKLPRKEYPSGVPRTVLIGINATDEIPNSFPLHIITSTSDGWPNIRVLYEEGKQARVWQMDDYERAEIEALTAMFYENLESRSSDPKKQDRLQEIEHFNKCHWAGNFNHKQILGTAFYFPECQYRNRCYKCRALYSFSMPQYHFKNRRR